MNPLSKVFTIIETVVSRQNKGATYSEITRESDLPKSSVHRILKDLTSLDYFNYDPATKRYFGSLRFAALGAQVMANFKLKDYIHPFLLELQHDTQHTANLGVLDGTQGVFVDKIESRDFGIKLFSAIGKPFPLHCTSLGKILLAFSPASTLEKLLEQPLKAETEKTITSPEDLRKELSRIVEQGYAVDDEEITRGIMCVAGPIFDYEQHLLGAISIAFPAYLKHDRTIDPEISAIKKYAASISKSLGGRHTAVSSEP
ncbi:MAG: IclR family transcriptional regulator [Desulfofustis sp.]|jgi:DNA-binding IclR family transcriptional regulator